MCKQAQQGASSDDATTAGAKLLGRGRSEDSGRSHLPQGKSAAGTQGGVRGCDETRRERACPPASDAASLLHSDRVRLDQRLCRFLSVGPNPLSASALTTRQGSSTLPYFIDFDLETT